MAAKSFIAITVCYGVIIVIQTVLSSTLRSSDIDELMIRDQKTRRKQNYYEVSALDNDIFENIDDIVPFNQFEPDEDTEEQPSLTVDYANMIKNDIILLDNSVETRTRKRGNIKVEKNNHALPDFDCNCEVENKPRDFGENAFPRYIQNKTCSERRCHPAYRCQPSKYSFKVLKKKERKSLKQDPHLKRQIIDELKHRYVVEEHSVVTACICTRDYVV